MNKQNTANNIIIAKTKNCSQHLNVICLPRSVSRTTLIFFQGFRRSKNTWNDLMDFYFLENNVLDESLLSSFEGIFFDLKNPPCLQFYEICNLLRISCLLDFERAFFCNRKGILKIITETQNGFHPICTYYSMALNDLV